MLIDILSTYTSLVRLVSGKCLSRLRLASGFNTDVLIVVTEPERIPLEVLVNHDGSNGRLGRLV